MLNRLIILFLIYLCAWFTVNAQQPSQSEIELGRTNIEEERGERPTRLQSPIVWVNKYRPKSAEKKLLLVAPEDAKRFADFLRQPDTGLFRLFSFSDNRRTVAVTDLKDGKTPFFNSYASMYSFSKREHGRGLDGWANPKLGWGELKLQDGMFVSGFTGESLGLLVNLGDVPLETVTPLTAGVAQLANFVPPVNYSEAFSLSKRNAVGYEMNTFAYGSSLPVLINTTYALRSTSYNRADVLVSFRVVRQDEDGSLTILWKKLNSYPKPSLKGKPKK